MSQPMNLHDRATQLATWVAHELMLSTAPTLSPITNDAGFRRYFRFAEPSEWLAVDAPPATEDSRQFIALSAFLSDQGLNTPRIRAADADRGFLLVEDFGDVLFHQQVRRTSVETTYPLALSALLKLQGCTDNPALIPRYDQALLRRELEIFREWFVGKLLAYDLSLAENTLLDELFTQLEKAAGEQPQTFVHRDFHSRNLIVCDSDKLGIIDFQGALWGPCTYDLVSLLRDCYLRLPATTATTLACDYRQNAIAKGILPNSVSETVFLRWFDWMGLQRHIKVLGIFGRLHLRDNKPHYLNDLPLVIRYTLEIAQSYDELRPFADWFIDKLLPIIQTQQWSSDYRTAGDAA